jgi:hypothetical protein
MVHEQREDLISGTRPAPVQHHETAPVEAADAPARVAPGQLGAVTELVGGVHVAAGRRDLCADDGQPRLDRTQAGILQVAPAEKILRLGGIDRRDRIPPLDRMVPVAGHDHRVASHGAADVISEVCTM